MSPADLRARGRESLRGNWPNAVLVALAAALVGAAPMNGPELNLNVDLGSAAVPMDPAALQSGAAAYLIGWVGLTTSAMLMIALAGAAVTLLFGGAIHVGYCRYHLKLYDRMEARFSDLFSGLDHFVPALCMGLMRSLIVTLGLMCFFIPGIIAQYGLCFTGYIMAEDPDCGAVDALKRSWEMTRGHKMDLFLLQLTFIGWYLLAALTGGIGNLFLCPYQSATLTAVYRQMRPASRYTTFL